MTYSILCRGKEGPLWTLHRTKDSPASLVIKYAENGLEVIHLLPVPNMEGPAT